MKPPKCERPDGQDNGNAGQMLLHRIVKKCEKSRLAQAHLLSTFVINKSKIVNVLKALVYMIFSLQISIFASKLQFDSSSLNAFGWNEISTFGSYITAVSESHCEYTTNWYMTIIKLISVALPYNKSLTLR